MRRLRTIEDRLWCFYGGGPGDPDNEGEGQAGSGSGGGNAGEGGGGFSGGDRTGTVDSPGFGTVGEDSSSEGGFSGADRLGTVDSPGFGTVESPVGPGGEMSGQEKFGGLPDSFDEFIGVPEDSRLFGTQDLTGTLDEGGLAFSTNTPFSREALSWAAAAVLPFGGALKALGILGPFHPDEHIPSSIQASINELLDLGSKALGAEDEEELRIKYGITDEMLAASEAGIGSAPGEDVSEGSPGGESDGGEEKTETETKAETGTQTTQQILSLGGHEIYVNGGYQVNYRAVDHVMRGVGETNFALDAIRELLEPPPGIGIQGGIPVYPLPTNMNTPELVMLDPYPPPADEMFPTPAKDKDLTKGRIAF